VTTFKERLVLQQQPLDRTVASNLAWDLEWDLHDVGRIGEDPGVRQAVVVATGYLPWPDLVELVRELAEQDPVDHVRHNAGILLEGLRLNA
jgi:hypothetical protein